MNAPSSAAAMLLTGAGLALSTPSAARAALIGIDARNGRLPGVLATGSNFDVFRETIEDLGHTIVPLTSFEARDLLDLDAVFTLQPYGESQRYTGSEIVDLHGFVTNGGGLVVIADGGFRSNDHVDNLNALVDPYGVMYDATASEGSGYIVEGFVDHPLTAGLTSFGVDFQRRLISINAPAMDLTLGTGPDDALAVAESGAGRVTLLTDSSMWTDPGAGSDFPIDALDNQLLLQNVIGYSVPAPAALGLLALAAVRRGRRR